MEALDFGKYNFYIWASYGLTFITLIWNVVIPLLEKKKLLKSIKRRAYLNDGSLNNTDLDNTNEKIQ